MRGLARGAVDRSGDRLDAPHQRRGRRAIARDVGPSAATDVSGFGLAGHLGEMLRASKASALLALDALPLLPGAAALLARGLRSTAHPENATRAARCSWIRPPRRGRTLDVLFDPADLGRAALRRCPGSAARRC